MRQKIFIFLLTAVFILSQVNFVEAKGISSGGSRSFSSGSRSSSGYSGSRSSSSSSGSKSYSSSSSKSYGGYSGSSSSSKSSGITGSSSSKSSSGYSSSSSGSSRSVPKSYSSGSSSGSAKSGSGSYGTTSGSSSKSSTLKSSYMQDTYKKQLSSSNYKTYNQSLNADQRKVYDSAMNSNYTVNNRMDFEDAMRTRTQRINIFNSRPVFINVNTSLFGGPLAYGSAFVGPWDLWFLMRASDLFWYHHWNDIYAYRDYFAASQFADMEARIRRLEQQNIARDPNYLEPGVDPDLQFSSEYQQQHPDSLYYTNKYSQPSTNPFAAIIVVIIVIIVLILFIRIVSRPRRKTYNSRIY